MPKVVDHEQRRLHYLEAFWRVVEREGVGAVSTRSVAAEAGMSKSNCGHYFASQNELIAAAVEQYLSAVWAEFEAIDLRGCTRRTAIRAILLAIPRSPERRRQSQVWLWLISRRASDPDLADSLERINAQGRRGMGLLFTAMQANGLIGEGRNLRLEGDRLHALVDGISLQTLSDPTLMPDRAIRSLVAAHVDELARPA